MTEPAHEPVVCPMGCPCHTRPNWAVLFGCLDPVLDEAGFGGTPTCCKYALGPLPGQQPVPPGDSLVVVLGVLAQAAE